MDTTQKIHNVRVHLDSEDGDTYAELEGSVDLPTEDTEAFLDELGELVRRYQIG